MKNKEFWLAAGNRALRTFCQAFVASIGAAGILQEVDWKYALSAAALAAIISIATSIITGLPEVEE